MHQTFLTFITAVLLTISTVVIICKLDMSVTCNHNFEEKIDYFKYKDYCVLPQITKSDLENDDGILERVTLILHVSLDYLDYRFIEQVESWDGPVAITVILPSNNAQKQIKKLQRQLYTYPQSVLRKVTSHGVFHSENGCDPNSIKSLNKTSTKQNYPINVARNIARLFVKSKYVVLADYEHIFSVNFEREMRILSQKVLSRDPKTALVYRIFETDGEIDRLPRTKSELRKLYFQKKAIEFHSKYYGSAHKIPHLFSWFNNSSDDHAELLFDLKFSRHDWEPQFVSLNTIPMHDESFPYSLRDNTQLRWEMCRLNYRFTLVSNVFMVHRGIKTVKDVPRARKEQSLVRPQFKAAIKLFNERMDELYPETKKICPKFGA